MTTQLDLFAVPVHRNDPASSREAARRVQPKAGTQAALILDMVRGYDDAGVTTYTITQRLFSDDPVAANKVQTRLRTLWRMGLVERLYADRPWVGVPWSDRDADALVRDVGHGRFLVYRAVTS